MPFNHVAAGNRGVTGAQGHWNAEAVLQCIHVGAIAHIGMHSRRAKVLHPFRTAATARILVYRECHWRGRGARRERQQRAEREAGAERLGECRDPCASRHRRVAHLVSRCACVARGCPVYPIIPKVASTDLRVDRPWVALAERARSALDADAFIANVSDQSARPGSVQV